SELAAQVQLYAFAGVALVVYTFGMETGFFRYARLKEDRATYYNLILSAVIVVSIGLSVLLFINAASIAQYLGYPQDVRLVKWFAWIIAADAIVSIPLDRKSTRLNSSHVKISYA